jgi:hypothetical protein
MASSGKKPSSAFSFNHEIRVEVQIPKFEPLNSLKSLDCTRFAKGTHKIEVGFVSGGCCRKLVRAVVREGMVTRFEMESCKDGKPLTSDLKAIAKQVRRHLDARGASKWHPVPITQFVKQPIAQVPGAFRFCLPFGICIICGEFGCFVEDIFHGPLR